MGLQDFRKLRVWQQAQALSSALDPVVARIASTKPGLADPIGRCANSISANIAEACGRATQVDKRGVLGISIAEACELESHIIRARNAAQVSLEEQEHFTTEVIRIRRTLHALRKTMQ